MFRQKNVYLIKKIEEDLLGSKLPSNCQVLSHFLFLHKNLTIKQSSIVILNKLEIFWNRANIPIRDRSHIAKKIVALFRKWKNLKKNANRQSATQKSKEQVFKESLDDLFDIAHANALDIITIQEDKEFLLAQREKGRRGSMSSVDTVLLRKEKKKLKIEKTLLKRKESAIAEANASSEKIELVSSNSSSEEELSSVTDSNFTYLSSPNRGRKVVVTTALSAALDRTKVSDRSAVMIMSETARSLGHSIEDLAINRSTIRRERLLKRNENFQNILENFKSEDSLVVHWDGKLLPDLSGKDKVDRIPILVSFKGLSKLLEVTKLSSGTGESQAEAVVNALRRWKLDHQVQALCFDTTASNTGRHKGACLLIEQKLGRDLLYFGCRHHIMEIILASAFVECMGSSPAPEFQLFKRFKAEWKSIDKSAFKDCTTDEHTNSLIAKNRDSLVQSLSSASINQSRDDYQELVELAMIFLGAHPTRGVFFRTPGAMHHARWMAKAIYSFKIWMFRDQFEMTFQELTGIRDFCVFLARVYVKAWTMASLAAAAPANDLSLLQDLLDYKSINPKISQRTFEKLAAHLWYLNEENVGFSFFDENLDISIKQKMAKCLKDKQGEEVIQKRRSISASDLPKMTVADFVTQNTKKFFKKLLLKEDFLKLPAEQWSSNESYQNDKAFVCSLAVTNDHAERGVALIQEYSGRLTKNEDQFNFLTQVVEDHRRRQPNSLKRTLQNSN